MEILSGLKQRLIQLNQWKLKLAGSRKLFLISARICFDLRVITKRARSVNSGLRPFSFPGLPLGYLRERPKKPGKGRLDTPSRG